jgi:hypothetical protein
VAKRKEIAIKKALKRGSTEAEVEIRDQVEEVTFSITKNVEESGVRCEEEAAEDG